MPSKRTPILIRRPCLPSARHARRHQSVEAKICPCSHHAGKNRLKINFQQAKPARLVLSVLRPAILRPFVHFRNEVDEGIGNRFRQLGNGKGLGQEGDIVDGDRFAQLLLGIA